MSGLWRAWPLILALLMGVLLTLGYDEPWWATVINAIVVAALVAGVFLGVAALRARKG
jgi:hypothetical protein